MRTAHGACLALLAAGLLAPGLVLSAALLPSRAEAQRRVVVEAFRGPQSGRLRASLLANLQEQDDIELVSESEVRRAARELGIRSIRSSDDYAQIARELNVSAFIDGRTSRRRRAWALTVRVRAGADGTLLGTESWSGRTIGALGSVRRNASRRIGDLLEDAQPPASRGRGRRPPPRRPPPRYEEEEEEEEEEEPPPRRGRGRGRDYEEEEEEEEEPPPRSRGRGRGRQVEQEEEEEEPEEEYSGEEEREEEIPWYQRGPEEEDERPPGEEEEEEEDPVGDDQRQDALIVRLDLGALHRSMVVPAIHVYNRDRDPTLMDPGAMITERRQYVSGGPGHTELRLHAEVYPGAFDAAQPLPYFGLVASYSHSLFLVSRGITRTGEEIDVGTSQSELYVGARGRYRLGAGPRYATLTADIGYGMFNFILDPPDLMQLERPSVIPPLEYSHLELGIGFSYVFVPRWLTLTAGASARLGLGIGRDAKAIWGVDTTAANGWHIGLQARSEAPYIAEGIFIGAYFEYFMFTTQFSGQTACANPGCNGDQPGMPPLADPDPWEQWPMDGSGQVTGGIEDPVSDQYFRFGISFGYAM